MTRVLLWCEAGSQLGYGHFKRSNYLYQVLRKCGFIDAVFVVNDDPGDDSGLFDCIIVDATHVPEFLFEQLFKASSRLIISPFSDRYDYFDWYIGRQPPLETPPNLKTIICEIVYETLPLTRDPSKDRALEIAVCLSGGEYCSKYVELIVESIISQGYFSVIYLPRRYAQCLSPGTRCKKLIHFVSEEEIWSTKLGRAKYFIGTDGVMVFEALCRQKHVLSVTCQERHHKVAHYVEQGLLEMFLLDSSTPPNLSKKLADLVDGTNARSEALITWSDRSLVHCSKVFPSLIRQGQGA